MISLVSEGWHHYLSDPAPEGVLLEWGEYTTAWAWRMIAEKESRLPYMYDGSHLYWRWTGIGREQVAAKERLLMMSENPASRRPATPSKFANLRPKKK